MFERIFVPLDGTEHAELALPVAARIAHATGGTLILVNVVLPPVEYGMSTVDQTIELYPKEQEARIERAFAYLDEMLDRYGPDLVGIKTETTVTSGPTSPAFFEEARLRHVDLIVLCSRGETGLNRWLFGSLAQQAVRHSPVPVLVLNEDGDVPPFAHQERLLRVLVPLDGSALSEVALEPTIRFVAALAGSTQVALHLLEVMNIPFPYGQTRAFSHVDKMMQQEETQKAQNYLHEVANRLLAHLPTELNLTITSSVVVSTDVAKAIRAEAEPAEEELRTEPYDLIALATHGRGGLQRLLMGSVTEHLLGATRLPLLIVRPHHEAVQQEPQKQKVAVEYRTPLSLLEHHS
jgi:nucleotide-binding universal stress UspA family protein